MGCPIGMAGVFGRLYHGDGAARGRRRAGDIARCVGLIHEATEGQCRVRERGAGGALRLDADPDALARREVERELRVKALSSLARSRCRRQCCILRRSTSLFTIHSSLSISLLMRFVDKGPFSQIVCVPWMNERLAAHARTPINRSPSPTENASPSMLETSQSDEGGGLLFLEITDFVCQVVAGASFILPPRAGIL